MKVNVVPIELHKKYADTIIVLCCEDGECVGDIECISMEAVERFRYLITNSEFKCKKGETVSINLASVEKPNKIIFVSVGKREEIDVETIRRAFSVAIREANKLSSKLVEVSAVNIDCKLSSNDYVTGIVESALLSNYSFDKYLNNKPYKSVESLDLIVNNEQLDEIKGNCKESIILAESTLLARDLVNEPANYLTPKILAEKAINIADEELLDVGVFGEDDIIKLNMQAFLEVAKASINSPKLIVMRYHGNSDNSQTIGLIGKGITYDSGGLTLKGKKNLINMKHDMAGAASVIAVMSAISRMRLKINAVGIIAACENMLSPNGYKPGDIINSMAGKTILITSSDAEGRLTLADAIHYGIEKEGIDKIIDIASLTGGARLTLGDVATAVLSNDDELVDKLNNASEISGEKFWRLPMFEDYRKLISCDVADLVNSSEDDGAKAIVGGMFISEFTQNKPWLHMDIAGTCWSNKEINYLSKGGTGVVVRSLYYLLKNFNL